MIILSVGLFLAVIICIVKLIGLKKQIKKFVKAVRDLNKPDYNKPVSVEIFDKDIIELANVLNEQVEMRNELSARYENSKNQIKYVIAGISHDFRTPLTAINGYMQMIEKSDSLSGKDREYLSIAIGKTSYLKSLSDDFFEISALEVNEDEVEMFQVNLNNVLSEIILEQYDWITAGGYKSEFELPNEDIIINTNEHYLKRIINNLFSNARKYTVSYLGFKVFQDKNKIVMLIENDMESIGDINTDRIFEPFYRGNARSNSGSGLGLYVVKYLAAKLGFNIETECRERIFSIKIICLYKD